MIYLLMLKGQPFLKTTEAKEVKEDTTPGTTSPLVTDLNAQLSSSTPTIETGIPSRRTT